MPTTAAHLPDAMPEISKRTLLAVCGSHQCRFIDAGGRTLVELLVLNSKEESHTDRESSMRGPSGVTSGLGDHNQFEQNRVNEFANQIAVHIATAVTEQKIEALYIAAPGKMLPAVKERLSPPLTKLLAGTLDGNYLKEASLDILARFQPELKKAADELRSSENYSPKNRPPQK